MSASSDCCVLAYVYIELMYVGDLCRFGNTIYDNTVVRYSCSVFARSVGRAGTGPGEATFATYGFNVFPDHEPAKSTGTSFRKYFRQQ